VLAPKQVTLVVEETDTVGVVHADVVQLGTAAKEVIVYVLLDASCTLIGKVPEDAYVVPVATCCQLGAVEQDATGVMPFKQVPPNQR
jgi:hypothetical protein